VTNAQGYRVVGVHPNGSRRLLCGRIETRDQAEKLASALHEVSRFASLVAELDDGSMVEAPDGGDSKIDDGNLPVIGGPWDGASWLSGPTRIEKRCNRVALEIHGKRIDTSTAEGRDALRRWRDARENSTWAVYQLAIHSGKKFYAFSGFDKD
jgi:hypothetical protein